MRVAARPRSRNRRRAASKRHWPDYWSNTCCSHPRRGEDIDSAIHRLTAAGVAPLSFTDSWTDLPPAGFVSRGGALVAFRRAASRLAEMQSEEYLKRGHGVHDVRD